MKRMVHIPRWAPRAPRHLVAVALLLVLVTVPAGGCTRTATGESEGALVRVAGSTTVLPVATVAASEYEKGHPGARVEVQGGGSSVGIESVRAGVVDIGMSSRDLKDEEKGGVTVIPIAYDAIAVIINPRNPVRKVSTDDLARVYAGEVTNWKELGGRDEEIVLVNRDEASGTREAFAKMVMKERPFTKRAVIQPGTGQVRSIVENTPGAIGYISLQYVNDRVKVLSLDGVTPTLDTIADGRYPLVRKLYFLTRGTPSAAARDFIEFVLSDRVQSDIVGRMFVPIKAVEGGR